MGLLQNGYLGFCGVYKGYSASDGGWALPIITHTPGNMHLTGAQRNLTAGEGITNDKVGVPLGNLAPSAWILPQKPGMLSSRTLGVSVSTSAEIGTGADGSLVGGTSFSITFADADILPLDDTPQVGAGEATFSISVADALMFAVIGLDGAASLTISQSALLGALCSVSGTSTITFSGTLSTLAIGNMIGATSPTIELTPEIISAQVWSDAPVLSIPTVEQIREEIDSNSTQLGLILDASEFIQSIEGGKWLIQNDQMIFYGEDNATEIARFDLLDDEGNPTMTNVMSRVRV
jgi:hypothetical protein